MTNPKRQYNVWASTDVSEIKLGTITCEPEEIQDTVYESFGPSLLAIAQFMTNVLEQTMPVIAVTVKDTTEISELIDFDCIVEDEE